MISPAERRSASCAACLRSAALLLLPAAAVAARCRLGGRRAAADPAELLDAGRADEALRVLDPAGYRQQCRGF